MYYYILPTTKFQLNLSAYCIRFILNRYSGTQPNRHRQKYLNAKVITIYVFNCGQFKIAMSVVRDESANKYLVDFWF